MAKVTSKLQVTIPKVLAERTGIKPGDDIRWSQSGEGLRISPSESAPVDTRRLRLELFDAATKRQQRRRRGRGKAAKRTGRGWMRAELYDRGRSR